MFSDEIKEQFYLDNRPTPQTVKTYETFFREILIPLEQQFWKDFYDIPPEEIYLALAARGFLSYAALHTYIKRANTFLRWYGQKFRGVVISAGYLDLYGPDLAPGFAKEMFFSEDELMDTLHLFPLEDGYLDEVLGALIWCGFGEKEILSLREEDVEDEPKGVRIYGCLISSARMCKILREYRQFENCRRGELIIMKAPGKQFIRRLDFRPGQLLKPLDPIFISRQFGNHAYKGRSVNVSVIHRSARLLRFYESFGDEVPPTGFFKETSGYKSSRTALDLRADYCAYLRARRLRGI